jgi:hypothetical protein
MRCSASVIAVAQLPVAAGITIEPEDPPTSELGTVLLLTFVDFLGRFVEVEGPRFGRLSTGGS